MPLKREQEMKSTAEVKNFQELLFDKVKEIVQPVGYKMLIALPQKENKTAGGIIKPDETVDREHTAQVTGLVIAQGPDCYLDEKRFPNGPLCSEGDWVVFRAYQGTRFTIPDIPEQEFRIINDDVPEAVTTDPRKVVRV